MAWVELVGFALVLFGSAMTVDAESGPFIKPFTFIWSPHRFSAPDPVPDEVAALVEASIADNTRRAYRSDLTHFAAWGGTLAAEPALVASYIAAHADTLSVATLVRRIATISKAHEARGLLNPCRSEIVRATLRGVKRTRGVAQQEAKPLCCGRTCSGSWTPWARARRTRATGRCSSSASRAASGDRKSSA